MADPGGGGPGGSGGSSGAGGSGGAGAGAGDAGEEGGGYSDADVGVGYGASSGSTSSGYGGTGQGRQDGPGSPTEGNQFGGPAGSDTEGTATDRGLMDAINSAIAQGMNPYSSTAQNVIAAGMISGKFGNPASFGIGSIDMEAPEVAGFVDKYSGQNIGEKALGVFGYNTNKSIGQNVLDAVVPGKQTPLGIISSVPSVLGMNPATQLGVTLGNKALGIMGIGVEKDTTMSSIQDTINDMNNKLY
jgi:hypothetical protein